MPSLLAIRQYPTDAALAIVHQRDAGPGVFADEMRERGVELDEWLLSERGTGPPREIADYDAVLTFGGAMHADQEDRHPWLRFEKDFLAAMLDDGMPILAVCLGCQLLAEAAGGQARRASEPEIGWLEVEVTDEGAADPVIGPLAPSFTGFQWHSYEAVPPEGAAILARSPVCPQAYRIGERAWGIQFHAEVTRGRPGALDRRLPLRRGRGADRRRPARRCAPRPRRRSPTGTGSAASSAAASSTRSASRA